MLPHMDIATRFFYVEQRISNSMYSPIAEASIKDLEIIENKAIVHTEMSYKENNVLRLLLKEVIKTISSGKEFQSLTKKKKKDLEKDTVLVRGCSRHLE